MPDSTIYKNYFSSLNISASALHTQRKRLDIISLNIANINTLETEAGGPYRRKVLIQKDYNLNIFDQLLNQKSLKLNRNNEIHLKLSDLDFDNDPSELRGVLGKVEDDPAGLNMYFDPNHRLANEKGMVLRPNINIVTEMVDMIAAQKEYEANITEINAFKDFAKSAISI